MFNIDSKERTILNYLILLEQYDISDFGILEEIGREIIKTNNTNYMLSYIVSTRYANDKILGIMIERIFVSNDLEKIKVLISNIVRRHKSYLFLNLNNTPSEDIKQILSLNVKKIIKYLIKVNKLDDFKYCIKDNIDVENIEPLNWEQNIHLLNLYDNYRNMQMKKLYKKYTTIK